MSCHWAFFWGQLSGMFEPVAGILGCFAALQAKFILPYALSFAAGAMVFVVMDDIIPEVQVTKLVIAHEPVKTAHLRCKRDNSDLLILGGHQGCRAGPKPSGNPDSIETFKSHIL